MKYAKFNPNGTITLLKRFSKNVIGFIVGEFKGCDCLICIERIRREGDFTKW